MTEPPQGEHTRLLPYSVYIADQGITHECRVHFPLGSIKEVFDINLESGPVEGWTLTLEAVAGECPREGMIQRTSEVGSPESYRHKLVLIRGNLTPAKGPTRNARGQNAPKHKQLRCWVFPILHDEGGEIGHE